MEYSTQINNINKDDIDKFQSDVSDFKDKQQDTDSNTWTTYKLSRYLFTLRGQVFGTFTYMAYIRCLTYLLQQGICTMQKASEFIYKKSWIYHSNTQNYIASL